MKQEQKTKTKKKTTKVAPVEVAWHAHAQTLPLALFHTTVGPIIGRAEAVSDPLTKSFGVRVWAPAAIQMGLQQGKSGVMYAQYVVTFQPIALVETYFDLSTATPVGRSPVPDALVPAYLEYFERVVSGEYAFNRIVQHVEQALPHSAPVTSTKPAEPASLFPWPEGEDYYTWLTRKVYGLAEDEAVDRDDIRRVLVKRALLGWAFDATPQKVASNFDFDANDVEFAYLTFNEVLPSDKQHTQKLFPPESNAEEENTTS